MSHTLPEATHAPCDDIFVFYFVFSCNVRDGKNHVERVEGIGVGVRREPRPACEQLDPIVAQARAIEV